MNTRNSKLIQKVESEFNRLKYILKMNVVLETVILENTLWITFHDNNIHKSVRIPLPHITESGIELLTSNDVTRVICDYWVEKEQVRLNYHDIIEIIICDNLNRVITNIDNGASFISKIIRAFKQNTVAYMVSNLQRFINDIINNMPLHETDMNSWAMNHRLTIIDPAFDCINSPTDRLDYRVAINDKYYQLYQWTAMGLSDNVLADKNVLLTTDLRDLTPFGHHHNPQRNLYSTLSMKGDELPKMRTKSMQKLIEKGITRKGWNLVTAILDTPLNFEDQILVDKRHLSLGHKVEKKYVIYGDILNVKKDEVVETGDILGTSKDGEPVIMRLRCESAKILNIRKDQTDVGGESTEIIVIIVEGYRCLKEGSKFSNLHGNKGVIKFVDLGYAIDPRSGNEIPIDVMVSAKSVNKRANFGQVFEALANNLHENINHYVLPDNYTVDMDKLKATLLNNGLPSDGVWKINTYCGEFESVVGQMFWGVTKDPEDQLWEDNRPITTNNRELRTSGLKFSHVEMKAITTWFGPSNSITSEILSYAQGVENLKDELRIIKSACNEIEGNYPILTGDMIKCVDTTNGIFHELENIKDTIVDDNFIPDGFILKLPKTLQAIVQKDDRDAFIIGIPQEVNDVENKEVHEFDRVFIPNSMLRRCWHHPSGKWGLSNIGAYVNQIIRTIHEYIENDNIDNYINIIRAVTNYFRNISRMMGTKKGELNSYGMSVRYPHSSRATATLSEDLPLNTIEIHRDMARMLSVKSGDVVLIERFPCLGFVSIRPQWVLVTDDAQCKYVIRVSGNSLVSENLDFDGDTIFIASFKTPRAIESLRNQMINPNEVCYKEIQRINSRKKPVYREMNLDDFNIRSFPKPTVADHSDIVRYAIGVKSHTGPVIALAYNLMRIVESNIKYTDIQQHVALELLLDFLGNTVFKQKHGIKSLQEEATDAICTGDVEKMVELGFNREPSNLLCNIIRKEALSIGIKDIVSYHKYIKEKGGSKIINRIVRIKNQLWFASRSLMSPYKLREHLRAKEVDLPGAMLKYILNSTSKLTSEIISEKKFEKEKKDNQIYTHSIQNVRKAMFKIIDDICGTDKQNKVESKKILTGIGVLV